MTVLHLRFLGTAEIELGGELVRLDRRYSLALLAYLVLSGRTHSREELATFLGNDDDEQTARKRLRNALADLVEHGLGPYLRVSRQTVAFETDATHHLDVRDLEELTSAGDAAELTRLQWAAEHADRELLAGLTLRNAVQFELWLVGERERCGQQLQAVSERLLRHYDTEDELDAGIALGRRMLVVAPWNEAVHRTLMRLLARDGQVEAALSQYQRCCKALAEELDVEPQPETTALFERLQSGQTAPRHNLPAAMLHATDVLGREEQMAGLVERLVDPSCRLLTLVGLGGSGKTSLALAAAAQLAQPAKAGDVHPFADGIMQVDLAVIVDTVASATRERQAERKIATSIGFALGMAFYGKIDRLSQLVAYLEPKRMLLILNNMEVALDGTAALQTILQQARNVTLLITSRVPLGLPEEWSQEPGGLQVPERPVQVPEAPASQLFLREARRAGVPIDEEDWPDVVAICRQTGGLPLALKIASGWLGPLSCAEIASELGQGGALLDEPASRRDVEPVSIRSIVSSAYDALPTREQNALMRLAVFPGRFDRRAAAAVGVTSPGLVTLSQRALLERSDRDGYRLHPLVSQYATEQLARESEYETEARNHHATHYASFVAQVSPELYTSPEAYSALDSEKENLRAAWDWAAKRQDTELLGLLWEGLSLWHQRAGLHREWTESLNAAIIPLRAHAENCDSRAILVQLLVAKAESLLWKGDLDGAFPLLREARDHARTVDMIQLEALISFCEGRLLRFRGGETIAAEEALHQARSIAMATNQRRIEANSLLQLGFSASDNDNYREAEIFVRRAEAIYRDIGDRMSLARTTNHLGQLAVYRGDYTAAQLSIEQCLHFAETFGDRYLEGFSQMYLGIICDVGFGRHRDAAHYFEQALEIANQTGDPYLDGNLHRASGRNSLHMGEFLAAERAFSHALQRARDVNNTRAIAESLRYLAQVTAELGDYETAEVRAQQSLHVSEEQGRRHASTATLMILGRIHERLRRTSDAAAAYSQAFNLSTTLGIPYLRCDATTGLASVSLAAGDAAMAVRYVDEILPYLYQNNLAGCEEPGWVARTSYDALQRVGDSRAPDVLRHGMALMDRRLMLLPPLHRDRYLAAFPDRNVVFQRSRELSDGREWPDQTGLEPDNVAVISVLDRRYGVENRPSRVEGRSARSHHHLRHRSPPDNQSS